MGKVFFNFDTIQLINEKISNNPNIIDYLESFEVYQLILLSSNNNDLFNTLIENKDKILNKITQDFNFFDVLTLLILYSKKEFYNDVKNIYNQTLKKIFDIKTLFYLSKLNKKITKLPSFNKQQIYNLLFEDLSSVENEKLSVLLYNLNLLTDFNNELKKRFSSLENLLTSYQKFDVNNVIKESSINKNNTSSNNSYKGSTILGYLLKNDNHYLIEDYISPIKKDNAKDSKIKCIGAGSTCLVYKVGDYVLKIGIDRNSRKIYVNHRILASQFRKFITQSDGNGFYVEIMKYLKDTNVTKEECDELQEDLLKQGLIWEDAKPENCGLLNDGDENISNLNVDYEEVAGIIDKPVDRYLFMQRKRKVVVLDNDNIRLDPKSYWK